VSGLTVVAMSLLGVGGLFYLFGGLRDYGHVPLQIVGFGFGASFVALFAQLGGGIYTKAADVGADLVGKLEAGIPEDDPRNPGVIADNVGDCVGDTAGMGADLFESYVGSVVAAMAIAAAATSIPPVMNLVKSVVGEGEAYDAERMLRLMSLPLLVIGVGLIASLIGIYSMKVLKRSEPATALRNATYIAGIIFLIGSALLTNWLLGSLTVFWAIMSGLIAGVLIGLEGEYYTSGSPVQAIARSSQQGAATTIITGLAVGFKSTAAPLITIALATALAYKFGDPTARRADYGRAEKLSGSAGPFSGRPPPAGAKDHCLVRP
jgi:K(+)-stimulated pyrophosphate-energized sodium pump